MDRLVAIIVLAPSTQFVSKHTNLSHCVRSAMKLYIYHGLDGEIVPKDVTHVIVDSNVTVIKKRAFSNCIHLVSLIMVDNVKIIELGAFSYCRALRFIRLSKTLEYIGRCAFFRCDSLEALFLPSTVKSIDYRAFMYYQSLRLIILPNNIDNGKVGMHIITNTTAVYQIAEASGVEYDYRILLRVTAESTNGSFIIWMRRHPTSFATMLPSQQSRSMSTSTNIAMTSIQH